MRRKEAEEIQDRPAANPGVMFDPEGISDEIVEKICKRLRSDIKTPDTTVVKDRPLKYWLGEFALAGDEHERQEVELSVQGRVLIFQRGVQTIVPSNYLEMNKQASQPIYARDAEKGFRTVGWKQHYIFTPLREATQEEYEKLLAEGNAVRDEYLKRAAEQRGDEGSEMLVS
jgi:hypothetical protein